MCYNPTDAKLLREFDPMEILGISIYITRAIWRETNDASCEEQRKRKVLSAERIIVNFLITIGYNDYDVFIACSESHVIYCRGTNIVREDIPKIYQLKKSDGRIRVQNSHQLLDTIPRWHRLRQNITGQCEAYWYCTRRIARCEAIYDNYHGDAQCERSINGPEWKRVIKNLTREGTKSHGCRKQDDKAPGSESLNTSLVLSTKCSELVFRGRNPRLRHPVDRSSVGMERPFQSCVFQLRW